jgi:CheY-like chemotaxis protein
MIGQRILLVEDSANDVALVLAAFEEIKLTNEVVVVRDGQQALDYLYRTGDYAERESELPVVVLLDIKLPKIDGLEVLGRVKNDPTLKMMPVVMLTSSREESDVLRSYDQGVNAYVVKPVSFPDFVTALKELGLFWAIINQPPPSVADARPN